MTPPPQGAEFPQGKDNYCPRCYFLEDRTANDLAYKTPFKEPYQIMNGAPDLENTIVTTYTAPKSLREELIESSVRMLCAHYFHKEMAQTAERAKDTEARFLDEFDRLKAHIKKQVNEGYNAGREAERERILAALDGARGVAFWEKGIFKEIRRIVSPLEPLTPEIPNEEL